MNKFYNEVSVKANEDGHQILLDGRGVKTPAKNLLVVPTESLANAIAHEWDEQVDKVLPDTMPLTRLANTAIDRVRDNLMHVVDEISAFGGSDLICYRASSPPDLQARQKKLWNPYIVWARKIIQIELVVTEGVMPIKQNEDTLDFLKAYVMNGDEFSLSGLHTLVSITGSLIIGLAIMNGAVSPEKGWKACNVDNDFQKEQWGEDDEATEKMLEKQAMLLSAAHYMETLKA
jgi:chaperone required for assembly of F1-ATPase